MKQWTVEQAQAWAEQQSWYFGANFYPSTAINQLEMWQQETFDPATIERDLGYAQRIGMNIMRVYLHDLLWEHDRRTQWHHNLIWDNWSHAWSALAYPDNASFKIDIQDEADAWYP